MTAALRTPGEWRILERGRLEEPAPAAARTLLGTLLVRTEAEGPPTLARIVETEAYREDDPASHSYAGRTERTTAMFERAGIAYVYRSYGIHWCLNVACEEPGTGAAVLIRAALALTNRPLLHERRGRDVPDRDLLRGPGVLTRTLAIDDRHYGEDLCAPGELHLATDGYEPVAVTTGPRVGIRQAPDKAWRFHLDGVAEVSRYSRHPEAPPPA